MTSYRSIIKQAFITAWQHKYLWFFGLFATLLVSNFEIELINRFSNREGFTPFDWQRWAETGIFSPQIFSNLLELARTDVWAFLGILAVIIALIAVSVGLLWISVVSQVALVSCSDKALAAGRQLSVAERKHDTSIGFREGKKYFWPVLALNIIVRFVVYILALGTLLPVILWTSGQGLASNFLYLLAFVVLLALALTTAFVLKYAVAFIVLKKVPFRKAVMDAWHLFWNNWLASLEMAFILFALSILAGLAVIIAVLVLAIPLAVIYFVMIAVASMPLFIIMLALGLILSIGIVIISGSIVTVVQTAAWVSLFNQLTGKEKFESRLKKTFEDA